jgi:hypothetical protein
MALIREATTWFLIQVDAREMIRLFAMNASDGRIRVRPFLKQRLKYIHTTYLTDFANTLRGKVRALSGFDENKLIVLKIS